MWRRFFLAGIVPALLGASTALGQVPANAARSVALVIRADEPQLSAGMKEVVEADLRGSGRFRVHQVGANSPPDQDFGAWRTLGVDLLVAGDIGRIPDGRHEIRFRAYDTLARKELVGLGLRFQATTQVRATAHRVADTVYERATGVRGIFSTRIAYVVKLGWRFELRILDYDGNNPQSAVRSEEPILSPVWSPDGSSLAYVSFEAQKPVVFVQSLTTGRRNVAANFQGPNTDPAWSPDGKQLAVVVDRSRILLLNPDGTGRRDLTDGSEPVYAPDGRTIYFTALSGGRRQIQRIPVGGGNPERVSEEASEAYAPVVSPDGTMLAYVVVESGVRRIALRDLRTGSVRLLAHSPSEGRLTFSPNGERIGFSVEQEGARAVQSASVSVNDAPLLTFRVPDAFVSELAWGPLARQ